jgi:acyl-homoserine-lactone acylase
VQVEQRLGGTDGRPGNRFNTSLLEETVFGNRQYAGELSRDAVVSMCTAFPGGMAPTTSGPPVDVSGACPVLAAWDVHDNLDSKGAILFRRFWVHAAGASPSPWKVAFDAGDAVHTPNTLNTDLPQVKAALGDAVKDLQGAGIPLNAGLRGFQYEKRGSDQIPIHGGPGSLGVFNAINVTWDAAKGYPSVPHGSSFVMAIQFNDTPCPDTGTILTYSLSTNPNSPYYADQTRMFSQKQWVKEAYCESEILADPALLVQTVGDGAVLMPNTSTGVAWVFGLAVVLLASAGLGATVGRGATR